jgi:hypothetical protein
VLFKDLGLQGEVGLRDGLSIRISIHAEPPTPDLPTPFSMQIHISRPHHLHRFHHFQCNILLASILDVNLKRSRRDKSSSSPLFHEINF